MKQTIDGVKKFNKTQKAKERRKGALARLENQLVQNAELIKNLDEKRISKEIETLKERI